MGREMGRRSRIYLKRLGVFGLFLEGLCLDSLGAVNSSLQPLVKAEVPFRNWWTYPEESDKRCLPTPPGEEGRG